MIVKATKKRKKKQHLSDHNHNEMRQRPRRDKSNGRTHTLVST